MIVAAGDLRPPRLSYVIASTPRSGSTHEAVVKRLDPIFETLTDYPSRASGILLWRDMDVSPACPCRWPV